METGNATVTLDSTQTLGTLNFDTLNYQYTLAVGVAGALVMDNTVNGTAPAQINDTAGGTASTNYTEFLAVPITLNSNTVITVTRATDTLQIGGGFSPTVSGTGNVTVAGSGTLLLYGPNTYGNTTVNAGANLFAATAGALPNGQALVNNGTTTLGGNETLASLTGTGTLEVGGTINLSGTPTAYTGNTVMLAKNSGGATQGGLVIAANSTLDITNNHMIITFSGSDPISSIYSYLKSGYNNGGWNGTGIISSTAQSLTDGLKYGVGFADGSDHVVTALSSGQIELKYTLLGDANLDGTVNGSDFSILAANFGLGYTNWDQGNFLFSSSVNGSDFSALAANFGQGDSGADAYVTPADIAALDAFAVANGLPVPTIGAVPEPASAGLLVLAASSALGRRRRKLI